jgi:DNA-binding MarR family transcriptional regulator
MDKDGQRLGLLREAFGGLFFVANALETTADRHLAPWGMTIKQWQLSLVLEKYGDRGQSLGRLAGEIGTSRQNVKQLALQLERKGLCSLARDAADSRVIRIRALPEARDFWNGMEARNLAFLRQVFEGVGDEDLRVFGRVLRQVYDGIGGKNGE